LIVILNRQDAKFAKKKENLAFFAFLAVVPKAKIATTSYR
jgi:hypothetical protein